ncbi:hypothetical protein FHX42_002968 [Saccharopolyspora lacisalsi]|uniref:Uncharacterized protein n=1 Tax=Halosaccharopolyspora lacisalsi TaxID=1000566 RepID=A0A839DUE2_9PSEU|nr:hypothetical protein [Halosaccharopolyspora lacisalsi]
MQLENRRSGLFLHEQEVHMCRQAVATVLEVAMPPEDSEQLITEVISEMEATQ